MSDFDFTLDPRFRGMTPLSSRAFLSTPTLHHDAEMKYIEGVYKSGWLTTAGENIDALEETVSSYMSTGYITVNGQSCRDKVRIAEKRAVALANGTAAIHLAVKLASEKIYHSSTGISTPDGRGSGGALYGRRVFVTDMTFDASVNPILYEGGEPVFIDSEEDTWNMSPEALEKAFELYPDVRLVVFVHLYGVPGNISRIKEICERNNAVLIEDAAEALGAHTLCSSFRESAGENNSQCEADNINCGSDCLSGDLRVAVPAGAIGDYGIISFNGNKIITGSSGGALIVNTEADYNRAKKWSTQSREAAPWYEHEELGYNYRISNIISGIVLGQWEYLEDHIEQKKAVYNRYLSGLEDIKGLEVRGGGNYWLSTLLIDKEFMSPQARSSRYAVYRRVRGKSCPSEILDVLNSFNAEGRPVWKPMHLQPMYRCNDFVTTSGLSRGNSDAYIRSSERLAVTEDVFNRGLCLPSDNKMSEEQQKVIVDLIHRCFGQQG